MDNFRASNHGPNDHHDPDRQLAWNEHAYSSVEACRQLDDLIGPLPQFANDEEMIAHSQIQRMLQHIVARYVPDKGSESAQIREQTINRMEDIVMDCRCLQDALFRMEQSFIDTRKANETE